MPTPHPYVLMQWFGQNGSAAAPCGVNQIWMHDHGPFWASEDQIFQPCLHSPSSPPVYIVLSDRRTSVCLRLLSDFSTNLASRWASNCVGSKFHWCCRQLSARSYWGGSVRIPNKIWVPGQKSSLKRYRYMEYHGVLAIINNLLFRRFWKLGWTCNYIR